MKKIIYKIEDGAGRIVYTYVGGQSPYEDLTIGEIIKVKCLYSNYYSHKCIFTAGLHFGGGCVFDIKCPRVKLQRITKEMEQKYESMYNAAKQFKSEHGESFIDYLKQIVTED